jgi:D-3-phosphoglycerate dehydrogenase
MPSKLSNPMIFVGLSTFAKESREPLDLLEASGFPFRLHGTGKRIKGPELLENAQDATVIVAGVETYDAALLDQLRTLQCLSRCGVGVDAIDLNHAKSRDITVANTPEIPANAVAELALAMFLSLSRNLPLQSHLMSQKRWERVSAHLIMGRTIGLIGLGRIGRRVATLSKSFGARIVACDPAVNKETVEKLGIELVSFKELLEISDIVSIHASKVGTDACLIGAKEFASMKKGSILVNLSRGDMVDESALLQALESSHLSAAGLDVYSSEPYHGKLCELPQVLLTPHSATLPFETRVAMEKQCIQNALDFLNGKLNPEHKVC